MHACVESGCPHPAHPVCVCGCGWVGVRVRGRACCGVQLPPPGKYPVCVCAICLCVYASVNVCVCYIHSDVRVCTCVLNGLRVCVCLCVCALCAASWERSCAHIRARGDVGVQGPGREARGIHTHLLTSTHTFVGVFAPDSVGPWVPCCVCACTH